MNLYNYYSNDGQNGRNFLNISSGVGDGLTIMRDNSQSGDGQHIFTFYTAISNNDGNGLISTAGQQPTHVAGGNNPVVLWATDILVSLDQETVILQSM